jgi:hypothetical protein
MRKAPKNCIRGQFIGASFSLFTTKTNLQSLSYSQIFMVIFGFRPSFPVLAENHAGVSFLNFSLLITSSKMNVDKYITVL